MLYRYLLVRNFSRGRGIVAAIGLNPSTASHDEDDPTIARLIKYAQRWGYIELRMLNAYAFRSTDPKGLWNTADPIGAENDKTILESVNSADLILCCWGANVKPDRHEALIKLLGRKKLHCLKVTHDGRPGHPLYLKSDLKPILWTPQNIVADLEF